MENYNLYNGQHNYTCLRKENIPHIGLSHGLVVLNFILTKKKHRQYTYIKEYIFHTQYCDVLTTATY